MMACDVSGKKRALIAVTVKASMTGMYSVQRHVKYDSEIAAPIVGATVGPPTMQSLTRKYYRQDEEGDLRVHHDG